MESRVVTFRVPAELDAKMADSMGFLGENQTEFILGALRARADNVLCELDGEATKAAEQRLAEAKPHSLIGRVKELTGGRIRRSHEREEYLRAVPLAWRRKDGWRPDVVAEHLGIPLAELYAGLEEEWVARADGAFRREFERARAELVATGGLADA